MKSYGFGLPIENAAGHGMELHGRDYMGPCFQNTLTLQINNQQLSPECIINRTEELLTPILKKKKRKNAYIRITKNNSSEPL